MPGIIPPGTPPSAYQDDSNAYAKGAGSRGYTPPPKPKPVDPLTAAAIMASKVTAPTKTMTPQQVRAMQQFLVNKGFHVSVDGVMGAQTKSAAQAFRTNHKSGASWSAKNGIGTHPTTRTTGHVGTPVPTRDTTGAGTVGTGAPGESDAFSSLLSALLQGGGRVGALLDPKSFGDAAAAPSDAVAQTLGRQIAANPKQEAQNEADISNWYGLDPKSSSYALSVLGRLGTARGRDAAAATDAQSNISDLAQQLAGSVGGSANAGAASVLGAGADAAGTMGALGEVSKQYADDIAPLLAAEARGKMSSTSAANSQALLALQDQLAQARGQAKSDRASAVMGVTDKNNSLAQQRFANEGNLLSTLSQMQAVDPNAVPLKDTKLQAQINEILARTHAIQNPTQRAGATPKVDLANAGNSVAGLLGVGTDHKLPQGVSVTKLAYTIGSQLQALGFKKGTPEYQRYGQQLISLFQDSNGNSIVPPRGWFGPGS